MSVSWDATRELFEPGIIGIAHEYCKQQQKVFGCHDVVQLDGEPTPRHLDYLDLLKVSGQRASESECSC